MACTTPRPTGARCWTEPPASGASMPGMAAARSRLPSSVSSCTLDYAPSFQMGHPIAFDFAERLAEIAPGGPDAKLDRIFFTGSGSESVDTALKIAIAYQRADRAGHPHPADRPRAWLSRRRLRRHIGWRSRQQPPRLPADARPITCATPMIFRAMPIVKGQPEHGAELADDLERMVALHGAETIAAVHRRAGGRLDRRAGAAEGLSGAPARDLHANMASC